MTPRESEAVAVAADALDGAGDPAALVVALVAELARRGRLPEREVAVVLAGLIGEHPEGAGLVRVLRADREQVVAVSLYGKQSGRYTEVLTGVISDKRWQFRSAANRIGRECRSEARAEAALVAAQPVPAAVVRVRS